MKRPGRAVWIVLILLILAGVLTALIVRQDSDEDTGDNGSARSQSSSAAADKSCMAKHTSDDVVREVSDRMGGRNDADDLKLLAAEIRRTVKTMCRGAAEDAAGRRLQVVCDRGYDGKPVTYCQSYDTVKEPPAALTASDVQDAFREAGLDPVVVRPTTESFATIVADDGGDAERIFKRGGFDEYSTQDSGTASRPICNVLFVPFVGAHNNTHANEARRRLEAACAGEDAIGIDEVAKLTVSLAGGGSPNCCDPNFLKPESMSRAVVIGAGGLPRQAEVGVAHVVLFPDAMSTHEYTSWYEKASADGGDGSFMKEPILRVCNAVIVAGGGVYSPEDRANDQDLRRVAETLQTACGGDDVRASVERIGGMKSSR